MPSTPRYGSAVELVALCYQTVRWCSEIGQGGVTFSDGGTFFPLSFLTFLSPS